MRMRYIVWLALTSWACVAPAVQAQFIGGGNPYQQATPFAQPTLSPYLQMLRGGNPAANYFLGVLPEQARRFDAARLNNAINFYNSAAAPAPPVGFDLEESDNLKTLPQSGHSAGFMFYGTYYNFGNRQRPYFPLPFNQGGQQGGINLLPRR